MNFMGWKWTMVVQNMAESKPIQGDEYRHKTLKLFVKFERYPGLLT